MDLQTSNTKTGKLHNIFIINPSENLNVDQNKDMKIKNARLNENSMEVLELVSLPLPNLGWWWNGEDIEGEKAKGHIFRTYGEYPEQNNQLDVAYLLVVDVTGDPDELNVSSLDDDSAKDYDQHLHRAVRQELSKNGMELIEWMSSHLNEVGDLKGLVTAYVLRDHGKERQSIALRIRVKECNLVIIGCFDISMKDQLAVPIFEAMRNVTILP